MEVDIDTNILWNSLKGLAVDASAKGYKSGWALFCKVGIVPKSLRLDATKYNLILSCHPTIEGNESEIINHNSVTFPSLLLHACT